LLVCGQGEAKSPAYLKARSRLARCWFTGGIVGLLVSLLVRWGNHGLAGDAGWQTCGLLLAGCDSECMRGHKEINRDSFSHKLPGL
jgi:hypothetical protein